MVRAIVVLSVIVLCSFAFVVLQLLMRAPAAASVSDGPTPLLRTHPDRGVYSVDLEVRKLERRLAEEEARSSTLQREVQALRTERDEATKQFNALQADLRRLRKQVEDASQPPRVPPDGAPGDTPPTDPAVPTPVEPAPPGG